MKVAKLLRPSPSQTEAIIIMEYCPAGKIWKGEKKGKAEGERNRKERGKGNERG